MDFVEKNAIVFAEFIQCFDDRSLSLVMRDSKDHGQKALVISREYFGLMSRVFANGPGDRGSIPGRVVPKIQKMLLDTSLLNTQYYKVRIKGKVN